MREQNRKINLEGTIYEYETIYHIGRTQVGSKFIKYTIWLNKTNNLIEKIFMAYYENDKSNNYRIEITFEPVYYSPNRVTLKITKKNVKYPDSYESEIYNDIEIPINTKYISYNKLMEYIDCILETERLQLCPDEMMEDK